MAQGNAARSDTSMEDILASIRRIIDESDRKDEEREQKKQKAVSANPAPANDVEAPKPKIVTSSTDLAEQELTSSAQSLPTQPIVTSLARRQMPATDKSRAAPVEAVADTSDSEEEISSLANVLARLDAEIGEKRQAEIASEIFDSTDLANDIDIFHSEPPLQPKENLVVQDHGERAKSEKYEARFSAEDRSAFQQVASALGHANAGPGNHLISEQVSQSVSQSFASLAEAFETGTGRELTTMAEDLMKPMLQDWLDNNLPQIVERLVRTEIERVARGEPRIG